MKAHAGKGMSLKQIAAKWQVSKAQRGGGLDTIYVAVITNNKNLTEILIISTDMEPAINAIKTAKTFGNWFKGANFGIVVETKVNTPLHDGIINEIPVYEVDYDEDGDPTPIDQHQVIEEEDDDE